MVQHGIGGMYPILLPVLLFSFPISSIVNSEEVFWNPGNDIIRHNSAFDEAKRQLDSQGITLRRVECPANLEDEILFVKNRYAKPDATSPLDIFRTESSWLHSLEDSLMDLSTFFSEEELKQFEPLSLQAGYVHGKLLSIPSFLDFNLLYYRKDLLHKYGYKEPPQTWDEMEEMAVKIQEQERSRLCPGETCFWGLMWQGEANEYLTVTTLSIISSHLGGVIVNDMGEVDIDNPNAIAALERMRRWIGWITPVAVINEDLHQTKLDFLLEKAVFMIDLTHIIGEIHNWRPEGCIEPFNVFNCQAHNFGNRSSYTRIPGHPTSTQSCTNPWFWGWSVNKYTKSLEATKKTLRFLASFEFQVFKARNGDNPTLISAERYVETQLCPNLTDPDICTVRPNSLNFVTHHQDVIGDFYFDLGSRPDKYGYSNLIFEAVHDYLLGEEVSAAPTVKNLSCKLTFLLTNSLDKCTPCPSGYVRAREHPEADCVKDRTMKTWMIVVLCVGGFVLVLSSIFVTYKLTHSDSFWTIRKEELIFDDPPIVLGKGSYGVVIRALFRGSLVAVKRVLPTSEAAKRKLSSSNGMFSMREDTMLQAIRVENGSGSGIRSLSGGRNGSLNRSMEQRKLLGGLLKMRSLPEGAGNSSGEEGAKLDESEKSSDSATGLNGGIQIHANLDDSTRSGASANRHPGSVERYKHGSDGEGRGKEGQGSRSRSGSMILPSFFTSLAKSATRSRMYNNFVKEMRIISRLRHPCITTVIGAVKEKKEPLLVMELMENGSLYELLRNETVELQGDLILPMLCDVAQGIHFLHAAKPPIIHGDIKSHNVLVDSRFRAKIADFGLSTKNSGPCGTPLWMAPELLLGGSNTLASDVYALGILLAEVYSRQDPFLDEDVKLVLKEVANLEREEEKRPQIPADCPPQMVALMRDCWSKHANCRPAISEIDRRLQSMDSRSADMLLPAKRKGQEEADATRVLYDVFPRHVADALKEGRRVEPERRESVTIFFSDIVGFTSISSSLDPQKVSELLDSLYLRFDNLSKEHGVFKVETIGDAYMAVTNLVEDQTSDHALRIASFALKAMEVARTIPIDSDDLSRGYLSLRIGFHSGPVVASVVGARNPRYCLFGDTVNTASRMESSSRPGSVHCSEAAAELLRVQDVEGVLELVERGVIEVKGKGEMKTFWVVEGKGKSVEDVTISMAGGTAA